MNCGFRFCRDLKIIHRMTHKHMYKLTWRSRLQYHKLLPFLKPVFTEVFQKNFHIWEASRSRWDWKPEFFIKSAPWELNVKHNFSHIELLFLTPLSLLFQFRHNKVFTRQFCSVCSAHNQSAQKWFSIPLHKIQIY